MITGKAAVLYLISYIAFFSLSFIFFHILIDNLEPTYRSLNGLAILYALLAYLIYLISTPLFYMKIGDMSFVKGFLLMCLSMIIGGFFIWLAFGDGDYSPEFYPYEFVSAGLWFGFCNAVAMCSVWLWKSAKEKQKKSATNSNFSKKKAKHFF
jgi:hypothetical protein